ncbi:VanZ family protein [Cellulomonas wangsupingiae]|uniref:VanZ family protein n=1 Tax=Cellulomonas wangsupingiae TaxID=2968085 RepID=A0ABY5KBZ4_9CELL|nr:VanZ family protein [Cellulomonas wangsupingiae]MCC2334226.1 VanZ family protein [Cellulomonas wangsupingiae]UUI65903.1 VanZ family protein [Cellulomonas wangsupingiae]
MTTRVLLTVYLAAVAAVTLAPAPADDGTLGVVRSAVAWLAGHGLPVTYLGVEAVANVVMFVPFGVLVGLLLPARRWWLVVLLGAATSGLVETVQRWLPTRYPTLQDVVMNTLGAAVGVGVLALVLRAQRSRTPRTGDAGTTTGRDPVRSRPVAGLLRRPGRPGSGRA